MENQTYILRESRVVFKKCKKIKSLKFTSSDLVHDWFRKLKHEPYEKLIAVYMNSQNEVISFSCESEGEIDQAVVYPRKVARNALLNLATRVIIAHNHPSGSIQPSSHDIEITNRLKSTLEAVELELLDHIIIGGNEYYSFREHNLI